MVCNMYVVLLSVMRCNLKCYVYEQIWQDVDISVQCCVESFEISARASYTAEERPQNECLEECAKKRTFDTL